MDRKRMFLMVTGLVMVGAVSSCTLDARDESARTPTPTGDTGGGGADGGSGGTTTPECREDFDCCANPNAPCGRECRAKRCACAAGFLNLNGTAADGCEYACHVFGDGAEFPNGRDDDCDGATDEGFACAFQASQSCGAGTGICQEGVQRCVDGVWSACEGAIGPLPEVCNDLDDDCNGIADDGLVLTPEVCDVGLVDEDCDGEVNEGCDCANGAERSCGLTDPSRDGVGICRLGVQVCTGGAFGACAGVQGPIAESCNGLDDDCDGVVPTGEADGDVDGYRACGGDCNDADPFANPNMREVCDGVDQDCNDGADEDFFVGSPCTGHGACADVFGAWECADPFSTRCSADVGGSAFAGSPEVCDLVDNDCNGTVDSDIAPAVVAADLANCGACGITCAAANSVTACVGGACTIVGCIAGHLLVGGSCLHCEVWPPVTEACDSSAVDEDCDGLRNEGCSCIGDTVVACGVDPALHGVGECRVGVQTCGGGAFNICTGAVAPSPEVCNGLDDDCNATVPFDELDADGDGIAPCTGDCNDGNAAVFPGAVESCNDRDDDCNDGADEDFFVGVPCDGEGVCGVGTYECASLTTYRCSTNPGGTDYPVPAPAETCGNLVDDDCDGSVDEGCGECVPSAERPCGVATALNGVGTCRVGVQTCGADRLWGTCIGAVTPSPETCNGLDDDCDGVPDDGFDLATNLANCGACGNACTALANVAAATCAAGTCGGFACRPGFQNLDGAPGNGCEYGCFPTNGGVEQCDGIDNDCDGAVDDDPSCSPAPPVMDTVTFAVTLPAGFPLDASRTFCSTFAAGIWTCGDFALALGGDGRTLTTSGTAVSGPNVFNLCTSACSDPVLGTWVVVRNPDDTLSQAAVPTVTFAALPVTTSVVRNARGTGGNWFAEFARP